MTIGDKIVERGTFVPLWALQDAHRIIGNVCDQREQLLPIGLRNTFQNYIDAASPLPPALPEVSEEMVERGAVALAALDSRRPWDETGEWLQETYRELSRAALSAAAAPSVPKPENIWLEGGWAAHQQRGQD